MLYCGSFLAGACCISSWHEPVEWLRMPWTSRVVSAVHQFPVRWLCSHRYSITRYSDWSDLIRSDADCDSLAGCLSVQREGKWPCFHMKCYCESGRATDLYLFCAMWTTPSLGQLLKTGFCSNTGHSKIIYKQYASNTLVPCCALLFCTNKCVFFLLFKTYKS